MVTGGVSQEVGGRPWPTGVLAGAVRLRHLPPPTALAGSQQRTGTLSVGGACVWRPTCPFTHHQTQTRLVLSLRKKVLWPPGAVRACLHSPPAGGPPGGQSRCHSTAGRQRAPSDRVVCAPAPQLPQAPPRTSRGSCPRLSSAGSAGVGRAFQAQGASRWSWGVTARSLWGGRARGWTPSKRSGTGRGAGLGAHAC